VRLFTAIDLNAEARTSLETAQRRLAAGVSDRRGTLRLVRPEQLHLTLVFIGDTPETHAASLIDAIGLDIPMAPFDVAFGGFGVFPPRGAPRVLWIGAVEGAPKIIELHAHVAGRLKSLGVAAEARRFVPHLTLARWRQRARGRPVLPDRAEVVARIQVERVTLFESRLSSDGPTHTALTHARLRCP
jgi:2'-5' RNA ligase